jgi:hypothetical protein
MQPEACEAKDLYLPQTAAGRKISGGGNYRGMGVGRHRARDDLCKHGRFERVCKLAHDAGMNPEVKVREIRIDKPKTPASQALFGRM